MDSKYQKMLLKDLIKRQCTVIDKACLTIGYDALCGVKDDLKNYKYFNDVYSFTVFDVIKNLKRIISEEKKYLNDNVNYMEVWLIEETLNTLSVLDDVINSVKNLYNVTDNEEL